MKNCFEAFAPLDQLFQTYVMDIPRQMQLIESEKDLSLKAIKLSLLLASLFREQGAEIVVVGGSAIEFYTNGNYMSGDVDVCFHLSGRPSSRTISEVMGRLGGQSSGGRSFKAAGLFVDILGEVETLARTQYRSIISEDGTQSVLLAKPEDLIPERVLSAFYPQPNDQALNCARKMLAACLSGQVEVDWQEVKRVASLPEYKVERELDELLKEVNLELDQ